jgi:MFS family permease
VNGAPATAGTLRRAFAALESREFRLLLSGRLSSQFADGFFQAYLIGQLVFLNPDEQGTAVGVATAYAVLALPFALVGPIAGVLIDRWSRRAILVATPLLRAVVGAALLALSTRAWPLLVLALVVVSSNRFFLASANASTPSLVSDPYLLVANSMATIGGAFASLVGIVLGTKLEEPLGISALPGFAGVFWLASAFVMAGIRDPLRAEHRVASVQARVRETWVDLRSGLRRLAATPPALGSVATIAVDQFLIGFVAVLSVVVFKEQFKEGLGSYGNLIAAGGLGVALGTATAGWLETRVSKPGIVALASLTAGAVAMAVAPSLSGPSILLLSASVGVAFAWRKVAADTIVQETVPNRFRGRVFSIYEICYANARVLAALLAIPLIPRASTGVLVALVGVLYLAWAPALPWWVRRRPRIDVLFGGADRSGPRAVVIGGEEEPVVVLDAGDQHQDRDDGSRYRLENRWGDLLDVGRTADGSWRLHETRPGEAAGRGMPA